MMLALRPDLCDQEALDTVVCPPNEEGMMDVRGVYRWQAFADYTPTGAPLPGLCPCLCRCCTELCPCSGCLAALLAVLESSRRGLPTRPQEAIVSALQTAFLRTI